MTKETIKEAAKKYVENFTYPIAHAKRIAENAFINGAKLQEKRGFNEEDMIAFAKFAKNYKSNTDVEKAFEQFKKDKNDFIKFPNL